jgi:hypothetical protein
MVSIGRVAHLITLFTALVDRTHTKASGPCKDSATTHTHGWRTGERAYEMFDNPTHPTTSSPSIIPLVNPMPNPFNRPVSVTVRGEMKPRVCESTAQPTRSQASGRIAGPPHLLGRTLRGVPRPGNWLETQSLSCPRGVEVGSTANPSSSPYFLSVETEKVGESRKKEGTQRSVTGHSPLYSRALVRGE